jgi:FkbM family methyltransferase
MKDLAFSAFLRMPDFRGKARLLSILRERLYRDRPHRIIHDLLIQLDPLEWAQLDILRDRQAEPLTTRFYSRILEEGDTYVDVGAHIGYHTLVARHHVGQKGFVMAIEPQPYNCERILSNWQYNGFDNVIVHVAAAGRTFDRITLRQQSALDRSRLSLRQGADQFNNSAHPLFCVPVLPLSDLLQQANLNRVKLLKIDVEGFEAEVLAGLGGESERVQHILLEVLLNEKSLVDATSAVFEQLLNCGFSRWRTVEGSPWKLGDILPENNLWASRPGSG